MLAETNEKYVPPPGIDVLRRYFNDGTALLFFDIRPKASNKDNFAYKDIAFMKNYLPDIKATEWDPNAPNIKEDVWNPTASVGLPYREEYSKYDPTEQTILPFKGQKYDNFNFGIKGGPLSPKSPSVFEEFKSGVRLQTTFLPEADVAEIGDYVGMAQVWVTPGNAPLSRSTGEDVLDRVATSESLAIPIYRVGLKIFQPLGQQEQGKETRFLLHYVATLGKKPKYAKPDESTNGVGDSGSGNTFVPDSMDGQQAMGEPIPDRSFARPFPSGVRQF